MMNDDLLLTFIYGYWYICIQINRKIGKCGNVTGWEPGGLRVGGASTQSIRLSLPNLKSFERKDFGNFAQNLATGQENIVSTIKVKAYSWTV